MELKIAQLQEKDNVDVLSEVMSLDTTRIIIAQVDGGPGTFP